jgi:hypothetical protein
MAHPPDQMCVAYTRLGLDAIQSGQFAKAEQCFQAAEKQLESVPHDSARNFVPLLMCHRSLLQSRLGKTEEAQESRGRHEDARRNGRQNRRRRFSGSDGESPDGAS